MFLQFNLLINNIQLIYKEMNKQLFYNINDTIHWWLLDYFPLTNF